MGYVLGIDLGTSSLKGILMDKTGNVICETSSEYTIDTPKPGHSEQHPEYWIHACDEVLTQLTERVKDFGQKLEGISFSGQMHSLVVVDENYIPVYPAILWNDVRTSEQCRQIMELFGEEMIHITKNIAVEGFTLPKILWLQQNEPAVWKKVHKLMLPKDYLSYWFTGMIYTEYSDAAGTLLLDVEERKWSQEIMSTFNIPASVLPDLVSSMSAVGVVREEIKTRFQLVNDVKVFAGGADNACAALGAGMIDEEVALVSIGTSGVISAYEPDTKDHQGKLHFFNHVLPDVNYSMGVTLAAGNSLDWFKNSFGRDLTFSELLQDVHKIAPGSEGLLFTPYIVGERTPHLDSQIRGSFIGIDTRHHLAHFARSVMEGITFSLKDSQEIMEQAKGKHFKRFVSVGGGAKNADWMQMQADIFNADIHRLSVEQGPGAGACMIAAIGCGWFPDAETATKVFVNYKEEIFSPKQENVKKYADIYRIWKKVYNATKDICYDLSAQ